MSSDEKDDFAEIRKADEIKQNSLMKKMVVFTVSLLVVTSLLYYFIEVYNWNNDGFIECDSPEDCASKCGDGTFYHINTNSCETYPEVTQNIWMPKDPDRCEELIGLSTQMIKNNNGTKDISLWSENHQEIIIAIEEDYIKNCVPTENDMEIRLPSCTITYIEIQRLIDKMEENQKDSLVESEQLEYDKLYQYYFGNYCNKLLDKINEQPSFQEFNATR